MHQHRRKAGTSEGSRHAHIATGRENHIRLETPHLLPRLRNTDEHASLIDDIQDAIFQLTGLACLADLNSGKLDSVLARDFLFSATTLTDPHRFDGNISGSELLQHGFGGEDVSTGTTAGNQKSKWSVGHVDPLQVSRVSIHSAL